MSEDIRGVRYSLALAIAFAVVGIANFAIAVVNFCTTLATNN